MTLTLTPRDSAQFITSCSQDVSVRPEGVTKCAQFIYKEMKATGYGLKSWREHELHPKTMDKAAIDWVFVVDALNFCFWSSESSTRFCVELGGCKWTGYWSLCAAINRALQTGVPITDPHYYSSMSLQELREVLRGEGETEVPLLQERLDVLHQVGNVLLQKYKGSFTACIEQCGGSARELLKLIVTDFPCFRDEADYNGKQVSFYKRAQILVADVWGCFEGAGLGHFTDIQHLTMFADYRVPQVLVFFGVMEYTEKLLNILRKDTCMKSGDSLEVEIRGCSIWAVELVCEEMLRLQTADGPGGAGLTINSIIIDQFLWDYRRKHAEDMDKIPYHKAPVIDNVYMCDRLQFFQDHSRSLTKT